MLEKKIESMLELWKSNENSLDYKRDLFIINEGKLFDFIVKELSDLLGPETKTFKYARQRVPPINILQKVISKLSKIYNNPPTRTILDGTDSDQDLMNDYITKFDFNSQMALANEFYNMAKVSFIMPMFDPVTKNFKLKMLLPHQFLPLGWDSSDRTRLTGLMTYQGKVNNKKIFYGYSDDEFIIFNDEGERLPDQVNGENIFGTIPGTYVNRSKTLLYPLDDTDMKVMSVLIPTMLADLNVASMFSCFSIMYGIDITDEDRKFAPNAFWNLSSDPNSEKKPEIGIIKPEADIDQTINLIISELSLWLNSKGIRPGSVGKMTAENMVSGVSKIIDEMDAFEDKKKQALDFKSAEQSDLWPKIMHKMHPVWIKQGLESNKQFTLNSSVMVDFPEQEMLKSRSDRVADLKEEVEAGFLSTEAAIKKLNPELDQDAIDEMVAQIRGEVTIEVPDNG